MGTLSKEVVPGLRIGWMIAAPAMIEALVMAKQGADMCTSGVTQRMALAALESGLIERLQPEIVAVYRARRDALCAAMAEHLSDWFDWEVPVGGMFVWAVARDPSLDTDRLWSVALEAGVCVSPSSVFDSPRGEPARAPPQLHAQSARSAGRRNPAPRCGAQDDGAAHHTASRRRYTSVLRYFSPESTSSVATLASGPRR